MMLQLRKQAGYTVPQFLVVLALIGYLVGSQIPREQLRMQEKIYENASEVTREHLRAAARMRLQTGAWPGTPAALIATGYLPSGYDTSFWGTNYIYSISGTDFTVSVDALSSPDAQSVAGRLPRGSVTGNIFTATIDPPGTETSHANLYARDGANGPLTGTMDANDNKIVNALRMDARKFVDADDSRYYLDPNGLSRLYRTRIEQLSGVVKDRENASYQLDLSGTTKTNKLETKNFLLMSNDSVGASCGGDPNRISKDSSGDILTCTNSQGGGYRWRYVASSPRGATSGACVHKTLGRPGPWNSPWASEPAYLRGRRCACRAGYSLIQTGFGYAYKEWDVTYLTCMKQ